MADAPHAAPLAAARPHPPRTWCFLEVLVAMSILVTLAGLLVPYTKRIAERTRLANATVDMADIAASLRNAIEPSLALDPPAAGSSASWMRGPGELPADCPSELSEPSASLDLLSGPLLLALQPDPWGSAYIVRLDALVHGPGRSLVLSAGPDRTLHTADDLQRSID